MPRPSFKDSKAFSVATLMPAGLSHWPDQSTPFDIHQSEVFKWLTSQPEIAKYIVQKFKNSGAIIFDPESKTWSGINSDASKS